MDRWQPDNDAGHRSTSSQVMTSCHRALKQGEACRGGSSRLWARDCGAKLCTRPAPAPQDPAAGASRESRCANLPHHATKTYLQHDFSAADQPRLTQHRSGSSHSSQQVWVQTCSQSKQYARTSLSSPRVHEFTQFAGRLPYMAKISRSDWLSSPEAINGTRSFHWIYCAPQAAL